MKIYTKTGDTGSTGLVGGSRLSKSSLRIEAIGEVDELNAALGVAIAVGLSEEIAKEAQWAQDRLFDIGSELATPSDWNGSRVLVQSSDVEILEASMDRQSAALPPLTQFILPGGTPASAALHLSRCVCRRAERAVCALHDQQAVRTELLAFLNRLSDWLFVSARTANAQENVMDIPWRKRGTE